MNQPNTYKPISLFLLAVGIWTGGLMQVHAQEIRFEVIDQVDLPDPLGSGSDGYLEFRESWVFQPDRPSLRKENSEYLLRYAEDSTMVPGERMQPSGEGIETSGKRMQPSGERMEQLSERIRRLPAKEGRVVMDGIRYEFNLLDPHLVGSGVEGFQEPDSMDRATRELQEAFIVLLKNRSVNANRYHWEQQLLSVEFLERWSIDPSTLEISREVESITPVIWQRRQTEEGMPVNEAGTGTPVYYKNSLRPVFLRNP